MSLSEIHERQPALAFDLIVAEATSALQRALTDVGIPELNRLAVLCAFDRQMMVSALNPAARDAKE